MGYSRWIDEALDMDGQPEPVPVIVDGSVKRNSYTGMPATLCGYPVIALSRQAWEAKYGPTPEYVFTDAEDCVRTVMPSPNYDWCVTAMPETADGCAELVLEVNGRVVATEVWVPDEDTTHDDAGYLLTRLREAALRLC